MMSSGSFNRKFTAAAGAAAVALLLLSCSGGGESGDKGGDQVSEDVKTGQGQAVDEAVFKGSVSDVTFKTLEGGEIRISDYGRKILYINYLATWNADCKKIIPIMNEVQRKFHKNVTVLGVMTDVKSAAQARSFGKANNVKFDLLLPGGAPGKLGKPKRLPTSHVVTRDNYLLNSFEGLQRAGEYEEMILAMYRRRM
jgi:thiol-disulfide isomerase/thioredoxin